MPRKVVDSQDTQPRALADELASQISLLSVPSTSAVRAIRREFSGRIVAKSAGFVHRFVSCLFSKQSDLFRFVAYELLSHHRRTSDELCADDLQRLGEGINSWASVDCFSMYLSGPTWAQGRVPDRTIIAWARSEDRWWRRAALVSTVALSRRGRAEDIGKVTRVCRLLVADRDDMVVKAVSWALRELAKKQPQAARNFLAEHREALAARVVRELENKLTTGLKTPRRAKNQNP
jgi:3-methyladenine DNA glycosylase AlkD